jgi:hypothetical protein
VCVCGPLGRTQAGHTRGRDAARDALWCKFVATKVGHEGFGKVEDPIFHIMALCRPLGWMVGGAAPRAERLLVADRCVRVVTSRTCKCKASARVRNTTILSPLLYVRNHWYSVDVGGLARGEYEETQTRADMLADATHPFPTLRDALITELFMQDSSSKLCTKCLLWGATDCRRFHDADGVYFTLPRLLVIANTDKTAPTFNWDSDPMSLAGVDYHLHAVVWGNTAHFVSTVRFAIPQNTVPTQSAATRAWYFYDDMGGSSRARTHTHLIPNNNTCDVPKGYQNYHPRMWYFSTCASEASRVLTAAKIASDLADMPVDTRYDALHMTTHMLGGKDKQKSDAR